MHPIRPAGSRTDRVNWDHWENDSWREGEREGCVTELPECDWVCVSCHWSFCQLWLTSRKDVLHPLWCQLRPLIDCWWQLLCVWLLIVAGCMNEVKHQCWYFVLNSVKKKKKFIPPNKIQILYGKKHSFPAKGMECYECWIILNQPTSLTAFPSTLVGMWNMKPSLSLLVKGWLRKVNLWLGSAQKMPDRVYFASLLYQLGALKELYHFNLFKLEFFFFFTVNWPTVILDDII